MYQGLNGQYPKVAQIKMPESGLLVHALLKKIISWANIFVEQ
jgi:hypothetical protein